MNSTRYGPFLVTAAGFALYTYTADEPGGSGCSASCLQYWPPLLLPAGEASPIGGPGVTGLGTFRRGDRLQVTFHGLPLYTYVTDKQPGQVTGQDVVDRGGQWLLATLEPANPAAPTTAAPPTTTTASQPSPGPVATRAPSTAPVTTHPPMSEPPATQPPRTAPPATTSPAPTAPPTTPATTRPTTPPTTAPPGLPSY